MIKSFIFASRNREKQTMLSHISLFQNDTLGLRTALVTTTLAASALVNYQILINMGTLSEIIFVNMFLSSLVEIPGCILGFLFANYFGRRWSHCAILGTNSIIFFILMFVSYDPQLRALVIFLCLWMKMNMSSAFVISFMQAMEIFPTRIRHSGLGFVNSISQLISLGGPYIILLGAHDGTLPNGVSFLVCLVGAIAASLLPETLNCNLPETIAEASAFGRDHKYRRYVCVRYSSR